MAIDLICPICGTTFRSYGKNARRRRYCSTPCMVVGYTVAAHRSMADHFWSKVDQSGGPDACWPWTGWQVRGYGMFDWQGKKLRAHRVAYSLATGQSLDTIPVVLHECDFHPCCNPLHLSAGTHQDNTDDMLDKDRLVVPLGEANGHAKLTADDVRAIRRRAAGGEPLRAIAAHFAVDPSNVSRIVRRQAWAHVD